MKQKILNNIIRSIILVIVISMSTYLLTRETVDSEACETEHTLGVCSKANDCTKSCALRKK